MITFTKHNHEWALQSDEILYPGSTVPVRKKGQKEPEPVIVGERMNDRHGYYIYRLGRYEASQVPPEWWDDPRLEVGFGEEEEPNFEELLEGLE